ncbi:hypothetical protein ACXIUS_29910 [Bosea thiooxidans]
MDTVSLTYDELATRLGITGKSARNLVRKKGWGKDVGNDGKARVRVPSEALPGTTAAGPLVPPSMAPPIPPSEDARALIARLESELALAGELAAAERRRGDEAVARADRIEKERDFWLEEAHRPWWKPRRRLAVG